MKNNVQLNIKISKDVRDDINHISKIFGVPRSEWLKVKITELVRDLKTSVIQCAENDYFRDKIDKKEFERLTSYKVTEDVEARKESFRNSAKKALKEISKQS